MIKFYVNEQVITSKVNKVIASDTINFVQLNFVFCPTWEGLDKIVQFTQDTRTYSVSLGKDGTTCYLPNEITDGLCAISVFGFNDNNQRITTVPYQVRIRRSGFMEDGIIPEDVQSSVYEQIIVGLKQLDTLKKDILNIKDEQNSQKVQTDLLRSAISMHTDNISKIQEDIVSIKADITKIKEHLGI